MDDEGDDLAYEVFGGQAGFCMGFTENMKWGYECALSRSARSEWIEIELMEGGNPLTASRSPRIEWIETAWPAGE